MLALVVVRIVGRLWWDVYDVDLDEAIVVTRVMDSDGPRLAALIVRFNIVG